MNKSTKLRLIYRHYHKDHKSLVGPDKVKAIAVNRDGYIMVPLNELTDEEIDAIIHDAVEKENIRKENTK